MKEARAYEKLTGERVIEAAPARARIRFLALGVFVLFLALSGRAIQLSLAGDPVPAQRQTTQAPVIERGDIVDRTGALLATNVRGYILVANPSRVWDAPTAARAIRRIFPELDQATLERRMRESGREVVYLRRGLTPRQRAQVLELGLAGINFEESEQRVYPMGALAGHVLGYTDPDFNPLAGVERGLNERIVRAGETGANIRLSIDARIQFAVEEELARSAQSLNAEGGAAIVLDGRTGETLALASWPAIDPNRFGGANDNARLNRAAAARFEMGSTIKPFTLAMALEDRRTTTREIFNLASPYRVDGHPLHDLHPIEGTATLRRILTESSNIGAAQLALRVGAERQRFYFERLGLLAPASLELAESARPIFPARTDRLSVAVLGYGHGLAVSVASLAGAYTVFANNGERVAPTLLARAAGEPITRQRVFSPETSRTVLTLLRAVVTEGTGRRADVPGLEIAGKTGTAEKPGRTGYDQDRMLSSFAAIFPASNPRYVIVLALDEPAAAGGDPRTGGAVAAPPVGRIAARIAPILGMSVRRGEPS
ncbi:MAG: peptidoglycan D,D-transpeptidase FtsI family protein [Hyphomonadaceae bacterium]